MKITHILAAGAVALATIGMASAQTVITITGSSAYRSSVHKAIINILGGTVTPGTPNTATLPSAGGNGGFAYANASDFTAANSATFRGYLGGDNTKEVIIKTSWTGSAAGIQTVASTDSLFTVRVLPAATVLATGGTAGVADATNTSNPADLVLPDIAMADNRQVATPFTGSPAVIDGNNYTTLTATKVGVVPFQFVKSKGASAAITNITPQIARALWTGNGKLPLSFFTGVAADSSTFIYATGRDGDSGTRISCFAETGVGITSGVQQYDCNLELTVAPLGTAKLYAAQTVNGISYELGQGGEKSGGTLAGTTKMGANGLSNSYIGYMSTGDATTLANNGGAALTYNGVAFSLTAVREGQYTFWGFEYLLYKPSLAGVKLSSATALANQIISTDAAVTLGSMHVTRSSEAGKVTQ
ncbi:MAG: hypothetical protein ACREKL_12170 [Chthoniobacterales bacterium]